LSGTENPFGTFAANFTSPDLHAREAHAAEIVDPFDVRRQEARRRRHDLDEFRAHADSIFAPTGRLS
jgi:hypothetical protein